MPPTAPPGANTCAGTEWQYQQYTSVATITSGEQLLASWRLGEIPALQQRLHGIGRATPPPGWLPGDPHSRALVLTGRPPPHG